MLLIYLGLVKFLSMPEIQVFLWIFGALVLVYSGVESIVTAEKVDIQATTRNKESLLRSFMTGFAVSITSPLSILFWLGIYGSILAKTAAAYGSFYDLRRFDQMGRNSELGMKGRKIRFSLTCRKRSSGFLRR